MEKILFYLFIVLVITTPFLYRFIRLGNISWFVKKDQLGPNPNYDKAENLRFIQIILGLCYFIFHGLTLWGWTNIVLFMFIAFVFSISMEIIGSQSGFMFGGKYKFDAHKSPGPIYAGIPLVIPLSWAGLTYMSLNYSMFVTGHEFYVKSHEPLVLLVLPSVLMLLLDLVLDPIAVDEKRWGWEKPGSYYEVPPLNFSGWFITVFIILWLFSILHVPIIADKELSLLFRYSPGILFMILPGIASRPCFERDLKIPGAIGLFLSIAMIVFAFIKYKDHVL